MRHFSKTIQIFFFFLVFPLGRSFNSSRFGLKCVKPSYHLALTLALSLTLKPPQTPTLTLTLPITLKNKAGYTATPVACGWAGAVFGVA